MDVQRLLDPELLPIIGAFPFTEITADSYSSLRAPMSTTELSDRVTRTDVAIGDGNVIVRIHRPTSLPDDVTGKLPCVFSMHGGGYIIGDRFMDDPTFDRWCPDLGIIGASVEYRLAPETPYPGPLDDCYEGLRWVFDNADELGIDTARLGIHGVSAGGGLCAGLGLLARDRGEVPIAFQLLDCPMLDDRQHTFTSQLEGLAVWSRGSNTFGWRSYLSTLYGSDGIPIYAAAARATDLAGLPPSYISVGTIDGFHDEDVDYAVRLNHAGVPCELHVYPGAPHGYQMVAGSDIAKRSWRDKTDWLRRQVA